MNRRVPRFLNSFAPEDIRYLLNERFVVLAVLALSQSESLVKRRFAERRRQVDPPAEVGLVKTVRSVVTGKHQIDIMEIMKRKSELFEPISQLRIDLSELNLPLLPDEFLIQQREEFLDRPRLNASEMLNRLKALIQQVFESGFSDGRSESY